MAQEQKTILITGAAKRIGRALALHFASQGWHVLAHYYHSEDDAKRLENEVRTTGGALDLVRGPLNNKDDAEAVFKSAFLKKKRVDALINNAAIFIPETHGVSAESRAAHMATNFHVPVHLTKFMYQNGGQVSINMLDGFTEPLLPAFPSYASSKNLLENWIKEMTCAFVPSLSLYGLKIGPTMKNERESDAHFEIMANACPRGRITPLPLICQMAQRMGQRIEAEAIINLA